jgi:chemotaxis protein MotC
MLVSAARKAGTSLLRSGLLTTALILAASPVAMNLQPASAQMVSTADPDLMVLELQILQDEIIKGNLEAYNLLQPSLIVIGRRFLRLDPELWKLEKNSRAAVSFMLSGGSGSVFQELAVQGVEFTGDPNLFAGAMAYSQGNRQMALSLLLKVDPITLPVAVAGQVALAQAILISNNDPAGAQRYFDLARLMMPGTLVEESALRRQAPMVAELGDTEKFERLSRRYLFQYSSSVFASEFRDTVADVISGSDYLKKEDEWDRVFQLVSEFDEESQSILLLRLAKAALISGNTAFAVKGSAAFLDLNSDDAERVSEAKLYLSAAKASGEEWEQAISGLVEVKAADLSAGNQLIQTAAIAMANTIREWPQPETPAASEFVPYVPHVGLEEKLYDTEALVPFKSALNDADEALKEAEF